MFSLPSSRRLLMPAVSLLCLLLVYSLLTSTAPFVSRASIARKILSQIPRGVRVQDDNTQQFHYGHNFSSQTPPDYTYLESLLACPIRPNPHTKHIRLPNLIFNVSSTASDAQSDDVHKFNPTIIALPHWSLNHYLLISRVVTEGLHQESLLCEANICHPSNTSFHSPDSFPCTTSDIDRLGHAGGLRCATSPIIVDIPPTPAERCTGAWSVFPDIPGFHDPRIFWSGKGEPLILVNSASGYACVGLWIVDLSSLYAPLRRLLRGPDGRQEGPLMSYPHLTELTRNPRSDRSEVEKNWMLFFPSTEEAYVHYDMVAPGPSSSVGGRAFAQLIGDGYTTPNLADPGEASCLEDVVDGRGRKGRWHQGSSALKLVLCSHEEARLGRCSADEEGRSVHFAVMHRKFSNDWQLPLRYERWFVVWEGKAPFRLLAKSKFPVLFANETAGGWTAEENWADAAPEEVIFPQRRWTGGYSPASNVTQPLNLSKDFLFHPSYLPSHNEKHNWVSFTYTPSIAWAWRPKSWEIRREDHDGDSGIEDGSYLHSLHMGYLDDEVLVGVGLEDTEQAFAKVQTRTLLQCLELCPGVKVLG